jgi:DnaJ-class molecular chaperone
MARDYYLVLGVDRGETPRGIRTAFLEQAKRHHPDRAGHAATPRFQTLAEAYETLSDPRKREAYDAALDRPVPPAAEPTWTEPLDVLDPGARFQPAFDDLQERFLRNFLGGWSPKGELTEGLNIEVRLTTAEAIEGVVIPLEIPTLQICDACDGAGFVWPFPCTECRRTGRVLVPKTLNLRIPPLAALGRVYEIPLEEHGIHNFFLRVHVVVDDHAGGF